MQPIEHDRQWVRVLRSYHDAVIHVPGLVNRDRDGRSIRPLGIREAARIAGLHPNDMGNRLNPNKNKEDSRPTLEGFVRHLLAGMDIAPLDEIERTIGRVAITMPEVDGHEDIQRELAAAIREFGDVGRAICESMARESERGQKISRREMHTIRREVDEASGALYELMAAIEEEADA